MNMANHPCHEISLRKFLKPGILVCGALLSLKIIFNFFNDSSYVNQLSTGDGKTSGNIFPLNWSKTYQSEFFEKSSKTPEVTHIAFLKVHKTASSSVQNIFIRFGDHRNLTFMLASVKHNECGGKSPHCISFYNSLTDTNTIPPPRNRKYEIMCSHVIYNKERFQNYFQPDSKYISLIREPVSRLASAISYFGLLKGVSLSRYADNPIAYDHIRLNNAMAYEFGFQKKLFPSAKHGSLSKDDLREIDEYSRQLINDFTLIMITERLPESLVLLKRLMNWKTEDILLWKQVMGRHSDFTETDKSKLKSYLTLDYTLYDMSVRELDSKIQQAGPGFQDEVQDFVATNKAVSQHCKTYKSQKDQYRVEASRWHSELIVTKKFCADLTLDESAYFRNIRIKQYGTLLTA